MKQHRERKFTDNTHGTLTDTELVAGLSLADEIRETLALHITVRRTTLTGITNHV